MSQEKLPAQDIRRGFSAENATAVTPSDTQNLPYIAEYLYIGTANNDTISVIMAGQTTPITITIPVGGTYLWGRVKRVRATGTTASGIIAFY